MEDFAQVFGVFPEAKYEKVGLARLAEMIGLALGAAAAQDFVARRKLADRAALSERETLLTVERVVDGVKAEWPRVRSGSEVPREIVRRIEGHMKKVGL